MQSYMMLPIHLNIGFVLMSVVGTTRIGRRAATVHKTKALGERNQCQRNNDSCHHHRHWTILGVTNSTGLGIFVGPIKHPEGSTTAQRYY